MPLLLILAASAFVSALSMRGLDPIVPEIAHDLNTSVHTAAMLASAFSFPYALAQPFLGAIGDALGKALVIRVCLAVLAFGLALAAIAPSIEILFPVRALAGVAAGGIIPLAFAIIGDRVPLEQRQLALSRVLMANQASILLGAIGAGFVAARFGWRAVMGVSCVLTTIVAVTALAGLPPRAKVVRGRLSLRAVREGYAAVFENQFSVLCYAGVFLEGLFMFGLLPYVAADLGARGAGGLQEAGFVLAGMALGGFLYTLCVPYLIAKFVRRSLARAGGIICAAGLVGAAFSGSWGLEALAFGVVGFGFYLVHNMLQMVATELAPVARGSALALFASSLFLGQAIGPIVSGVIFTSVGAIPVFLTSAAGILMVALWISTWIGQLSAAFLWQSKR
jgi:MFS transporter, DHA1 family, inner membrane transport protein